MRRRVLVVDDSATLRHIVAAVLTEAGHEVVTASDGAEGLERLLRFPADMALVDFVMPRVNGYQFAQALRTLPGRSEIPLVLMSAKADQIGPRFMDQTRAAAVLAKPFRPDELIAAVSKALGDASASASRAVEAAAGRVPTVPANAPPTLPTLRVSAPAPEIETFEEGFAFTTPPGALEGPWVAAEEAERFLSFLTADEGALRGEPEGARGPSEHAASRSSNAPRYTWTPGAGPTIAASQESAHARFTESLGKLLLPVVADLAASGGNVSEDAMVQVLRFYLSKSTVTALARELRALDPALRGPVALEGLVGAVPLGEVFQLLGLQAQSGLLVIERSPRPGAPVIQVVLRSGRVDQAVGAHLGPEFLLGRYLALDGALPRAEIESAVSTARAKGQTLGQSLVASGRVGAAVLERALRRQSSELVYEVLRWSGGRFRFEPGVGLPFSPTAGLELHSEVLVLEAVRRIDEWRLIGEYIPSDRTVLAPNPAGAANTLERLDADDRRVLEAVDGRRTVGEVVEGVGLSSFDGCKILYRLLRARLVVPVAA